MTDRDELLALVRQIADPSDDMGDEELSRLEERFADSIRHPGGEDLINYPDRWGLPPDPSPEQVVEAAVSWKPRALVMRVTHVRPHPLDDRFALLRGGCRRSHRTQVVAPVGIAAGAAVVIALSGCRLPDGT